jgi:N-acetylglutamate synthase-like GNAT family acetyltransferase
MIRRRQVTNKNDLFVLLPLIAKFQQKTGGSFLNEEFLEWLIKSNDLQIWLAYNGCVPIGYIIFGICYNYFLPHVFVYQVYLESGYSAKQIFLTLLKLVTKELGLSKIRMITKRDKGFQKKFGFNELGVLMEMEA